MRKAELLRYNEFLLKQMDLTRKRVIQPIFRGDSLENLCYKLNVEYFDGDAHLPTLLNRLFMVGEKAQRFYTDSENFRIDETDDFVFERIMKFFKSSIKSKNTNTILFFNRNTHLRNFFSVQRNKSVFLDIIQNASEGERLAIRNYYLTLLHQLAAINYKKKSHFVSTSIDYTIAERFADSKRKKSRIILHCWQPILIQKQTVKKYNLPTYSIGPYHYQRELSVIGGILPHYIAGLEIGENEFYPNPNIFNTEITNRLFLRGLEIDQSNFHEIASLTRYKITLHTDGNRMWEI